MRYGTRPRERLSGHENTFLLHRNACRYECLHVVLVMPLASKYNIDAQFSSPKQSRAFNPTTGTIIVRHEHLHARTPATASISLANITSTSPRLEKDTVNTSYDNTTEQNEHSPDVSLFLSARRTACEQNSERAHIAPLGSPLTLVRGSSPFATTNTRAASSMRSCLNTRALRSAIRSTTRCARSARA